MNMEAHIAHRKKAKRGCSGVKMAKCELKKQLQLPEWASIF
jgi:hypothetical protein